MEDNLILPVQRLPRYQLLLQVIRKNTPEDHIDYRPVESAIRQIVHMNNAIDLKLKQIESRHILKTIESWCADTKTPLYVCIIIIISLIEKELIFLKSNFS